MLQAARDEFASNGFSGTHIAVVAARVGLRKSTFFHYFEDKESLYDAAVGALLDDVAVAVDVVAAAPHASFAERIDAVVECLFMQLASDDSLPRLMLRSLVDAPPPATPRPTAIDRITARVVEAVQAGFAAGQLPRGDPMHVVPALLMLVSLAHNPRLPVWIPESEPLIGVTADMHLAGIKERARRLLAVR